MPNSERLHLSPWAVSCSSPLGPSKLQRQQAVEQQGLGPGRGHWPEVWVSRLSMCRDHMSEQWTGVSPVSQRGPARAEGRHPRQSRLLVGLQGTEGNSPRLGIAAAAPVKGATIFTCS